MLCILSLRALAAHSLLFLLPRHIAIAQSLTATTTTTLTSTTTVFTSTITVTGSGPNAGSVTTETGIVVGGATSTFTSNGLTYITTLPATTILADPKATGAVSYEGFELAAAVLNSTNYYRAQYQANAVSWSGPLAFYAQSYAQKCISGHSNGTYGENFATGYASPTLAIDAWAAEQAYYDYAKPRYYDATGNFTQLVWKNTTAVGCGATQCNNGGASGIQGWFMVCEFLPRGNVDGQFVVQVTKQGESATGQLGFGSGTSVRVGWMSLLLPLVAACALGARCV